jgi:hypothetical protein
MMVFFNIQNFENQDFLRLLLFLLFCLFMRFFSWAVAIAQAESSVWPFFFNSFTSRSFHAGILLFLCFCAARVVTGSPHAIKLAVNPTVRVFQPKTNLPQVPNQKIQRDNRNYSIQILNPSITKTPPLWEHKRFVTPNSYPRDTL